MGDIDLMTDPFVSVRNGPNFNIQEVDNLDTICDDNHTLLQDAIVRQPQFAAALIEAGVTIDHQDDNGQTALHYAISRGYYDIARLLLKNGARVDQPDKHGNEVLWTAVVQPKPDLELIRQIRLAGGDPQHVNLAGRSPMEMAKIKNNAAMIDLLTR